jgi:hypothetical protein
VKNVATDVSMKRGATDVRGKMLRQLSMKNGREMFMKNVATQPKIFCNSKIPKSPELRRSSMFIARGKQGNPTPLGVEYWSRGAIMK